MRRPGGGGLSGPAPERFRGKYSKGASGCWSWTGCKNSRGYGCFFDGARVVLAHRWSYEHHVGLIVGDLTIDHLCRNRLCVNPAHLETVTGAENTRRGGNSAKTHCKAGHRLAGENLISRKDGRRACRECKLAWNRRQRVLVAA